MFIIYSSANTGVAVRNKENHVPLSYNNIDEYFCISNILLILNNN